MLGLIIGNVEVQFSVRECCIICTGVRAIRSRRLNGEGVTGCWSNYEISHLCFLLFLISGVPENHRSVFVEEDFSVVESLAFVGQRVGLILLACESMDNRVRKTRRRRHHGRKLSQERLRPMRRLELPSPYAVWRDRLFHTTQKPHRINRGLPLNQIPIIKQR